jgi:hypothetical protein
MRSWESVRLNQPAGVDSHGRMDHPNKELTPQKLSFG